MKENLIDQNSRYFALIVFLFSLILFFINTSKFWQSLIAAILAAALAWFSYVGIRLIYLTFK